MSSEPSPWAALGDLDEFGTHRWDKAPLHSSASATFDARTIVTLHELDRLISSRHSDVRLMENGSYVDDSLHREPALRRRDERKWLSDPAAVLARFRAGATIVLPSAHEMWAPIERLTFQLAHILDAQVGATVFVSPPDSLTDWHADGAHLFVLHLYGGKHWLVERDGPNRQPQVDPPLAVALRPGDVLYVPRGFLHRVHGGDDLAVHVSFYSAADTWADLIKSALASRIDALSNPRLQRNPLNPQWGAASRAEWAATLDRLMGDVQEVMCDVQRARSSLDADTLAPTRARRPLDRVSQDDAFLEACDAFGRLKPQGSETAE